MGSPSAEAPSGIEPLAHCFIGSFDCQWFNFIIVNREDLPVLEPQALGSLFHGSNAKGDMLVELNTQFLCTADNVVATH